MDYIDSNVSYVVDKSTAAVYPLSGPPEYGRWTNNDQVYRRRKRRLVQNLPLLCACSYKRRRLDSEARVDRTQCTADL